MMGVAQAYVRLPAGLPQLVSIKYAEETWNLTVADLKRDVAQKTGVDCATLRLLTSGGINLDDSDLLFRRKDSMGHPHTYTLIPRLLGGKGGFGSMLRAQGGRMSSQKAMNIDSCRDLSGRRLNTVNLAKRIVARNARRAEVEKEAAEKLDKKIKRCLQKPAPKKVDNSKYTEMHNKAIELLDKSLKKAPTCNVAGSTSSKFTKVAKYINNQKIPPSSCAPKFFCDNDASDVFATL